MKKQPLRILFLSLSIASCTLISSCEAIKNFLAKDLDQSDEDWIIGKLYEDEYVKETPYQPASTSPAPLPTGGYNSASQALLSIRTASDDGALFDALLPWMGTPYKYGGSTKSGVDCSAFVGAIYRSRYKVNLHRTANDIQKDVEFVDKKNLKQGDILFFTNSNGKVSHVGIYLKDVTFVHSSTSNGVSLSRFDTGYWSKRLYRCGRVKR